MAELNARIKDIPIPSRLRGRPISRTGYPIPFFVAWLKDGHPVPEGEGEPDFRVVTPGRVADCHYRQKCWLCGQQRGTYLCFPIGPMCAINRISSEPPSHRDCAIYAARVCPFLTQPRMRRNEADLPEARFVQGGFISRNPGVTGLWITRKYGLTKTPTGMMFRLGEPTEVLWFCEGRDSTLAEVQRSIESGLPLLAQQYEQVNGGGSAALKHDYEEMKRWLPKDTS